MLATQTLIAKRSKKCTPSTALPFGTTASDLILAIIGEVGTAGGTGHVIEYAGLGGPGIVDGRPHDGSNMSIEAGARAGPIAPDETTLRLSEGLSPVVPSGEAPRGPSRCGGAAVGQRCAAYDRERSRSMPPRSCRR